MVTLAAVDHLKRSTSAVAEVPSGGRWWSAGNGKCAVASDSHPPVQQFLAPRALRPVWKCHLVTAYHHCSASRKLVLWSSFKTTRLLWDSRKATHSGINLITCWCPCCQYLKLGKVNPSPIFSKSQPSASPSTRETVQCPGQNLILVEVTSYS